MKAVFIEFKESQIQKLKVEFTLQLQLLLYYLRQKRLI